MQPTEPVKGVRYSNPLLLTMRATAPARARRIASSGPSGKTRFAQGQSRTVIDRETRHPIDTRLL